ncbi:MAG: helix-turn-helix domain-containing protein [Clostridia bacterium]|nr:helix-turn-helix domain-containing protein [Clostridia bacterium]
MSLKHDEQTDELFRSILALNSVDECYLYFEDLCTNREIRDFGQRLEIARLISEGKSYLQAAQILGVSSATIGRVKRCLDYGNGGYQMMIKRLGRRM